MSDVFRFTVHITEMKMIIDLIYLCDQNLTQVIGWTRTL